VGNRTQDPQRAFREQYLLAYDALKPVRTGLAVNALANPTYDFFLRPARRQFAPRHGTPQVTHPRTSSMMAMNRLTSVARLSWPMATTLQYDGRRQPGKGRKCAEPRDLFPGYDPAEPSIHHPRMRLGIKLLSAYDAVGNTGIIANRDGPRAT